MLLLTIEILKKECNFPYGCAFVEVLLMVTSQLRSLLELQFLLSYFTECHAIIIPSTLALLLFSGHLFFFNVVCLLLFQYETLIFYPKTGQKGNLTLEILTLEEIGQHICVFSSRTKLVSQDKKTRLHSYYSIHIIKLLMLRTCQFFHLGWLVRPL